MALREMGDLEVIYRLNSSLAKGWFYLGNYFCAVMGDFDLALATSL